MVVFFVHVVWLVFSQVEGSICDKFGLYWVGSVDLRISRIQLPALHRSHLIHPRVRLILLASLPLVTS